MELINEAGRVMHLDFGAKYCEAVECSEAFWAAGQVTLDSEIVHIHGLQRKYGFAEGTAAEISHQGGVNATRKANLII